MRRLTLELWPVYLLLLLWQVWVSAAGYNSIVLVPPGAVISDLVRFPAAYLPPVLHTLVFALGGLGLGMAAGVLEPRPPRPKEQKTATTHTNHPRQNTTQKKWH
jgi:ABC-type nitrate/sulfonate/bicarbonate transport system permease component